MKCCLLKITKNEVIYTEDNIKDEVLSTEDNKKYEVLST